MRRPKKSFKKTFLYLNLFFLIFVSGYFIIQRIKNSSNVLNTSVVNLTRISNYDLEYRDTDGNLKSLVPKDCQNFNYSFMSTTCNRDMRAPSTFWPSPTYGYINTSFVIGLNYGGNGIVFNNSGTSNFNIFRDDFKRYRPILDEVDGIPVLSYYGGLYEVNRTDNRAYLLTRYFNTQAYYSKGCLNSKVPQNLYRLEYYNTSRGQNSSVFTYGMSGLALPDDYTYFNCTELEYNAGAEGCYKCPNQNSLLGCSRAKAESLGAPELMEPSLRVRNYVNAWRTEYKCTSFDNTDFHFNMPKTHQIVVSKCKSGETCTNSGDLTVIAKNSQWSAKSLGYGFDDFRASCVGKSNNGSCNSIILSKSVNDYNYSNNTLTFSYVSKTGVFKNTDGRGFSVKNKSNFQDSNGYWNSFESCLWERESGLPLVNCFTGNSIISRENTPYPSYQSMFEPFVNYTFGYETPKNATYKAIDFNKEGYVYKIPKYFNDVREKNDPVIPVSNVKTPLNLPGSSNISFATDEYIYSVRATTSNISVFRYNTKDSASSAILNFTDYYPEFRNIKDISVGVSRDGTDQIDIMFSSRPSSGFNQSRLVSVGLSPSDLRVYRIHNALSTNPLKTLRIEDISARFNLTSGGQRIYPISFKRYLDSVTKRDYYVYVTTDQIYTSEVPPSTNCEINIDRISIVNTSPLSILNGLESYETDGSNKVDFRLGKAFECTGNPNLLPSSITLKAFDPITNNQVGRIYSTTLQPDNTDFSFNLDANFLSSKKYNFELTFIVDGENFVYNQTLKPTIMPRGYFFSFESRINFELYDVLPDGTSQPSYDTSVSYQKNNLPVVEISSGASDIVIGSEDIGGTSNVYFDHNLSRVASGQLDSITNKFCFGNKTIKNVSIGTNVVNPGNYINTTLTNSNKCLETVYKSNELTAYDLKPALIKIYFNVSEAPAEGSFSNFEINGNLFSKTDIGKVIRTFPSSSRPFQGNYISSGNITSYNIKTFNNSTLNLSKYAPLPSFLEGYSIPTGNVLSSTNLNFGQFNLLIDNAVNERNINYTELKGNSTNEYEIIVVSKGKGLKIDLNDTNLADTTNIFDKYIIINLDKEASRISFIVDCDKSTYSQICTPGATFYFKGLLVGKFDIDGKLNNAIDQTKFINISENPDVFMKLLRDIRENKKPLINTTKINLKYIN